MDEFLDKLLKIQSDYFRRRQFLFILDLISVFSIFYAISIIFSVEYFLEHSSSLTFIPISIIKIMPPVLALIIAIIGAFLLHRNDHKININLLIENKDPELKEKLRTAYDNRNETNVIVESLKNLVSSELTVVSASSLISTGVVVTKIILVAIFIGGAAEVSYHPDQFVIPPDTISDNFKNITGIGQGTGNETLIIPVGPIQNLQNVGSQGNGTIIGKPRIASLQGKNIDLTLFQGQGTGFVPSAPNQQTNQFMPSNGTLYPVDVLGSNVSDGGYSILMQKTQADKQLIQDYAVNISKI